MPSPFDGLSYGPLCLDEQLAWQEIYVCLSSITFLSRDFSGPCSSWSSSQVWNLGWDFPDNGLDICIQHSSYYWQSRSWYFRSISNKKKKCFFEVDKNDTTTWVVRFCLLLIQQMKFIYSWFRWLFVKLRENCKGMTPWQRPVGYMGGLGFQF